MTKKHYIAFAAALQPLITQLRTVNDERSYGMVAGLMRAAAEFADIAASDNPRFDRARFLKACGL